MKKVLKSSIFLKQFMVIRWLNVQFDPLFNTHEAPVCAVYGKKKSFHIQ